MVNSTTEVSSCYGVLAANSPSNVNIGQRASGNFSFNGRIDDVRIYSRALTQTEIQLDMNTPLVAMSADELWPPTVAAILPMEHVQVYTALGHAWIVNSIIGVLGFLVRSPWMRKIGNCAKVVERPQLTRSYGYLCERIPWRWRAIRHLITRLGQCDQLRPPHTPSA